MESILFGHWIEVFLYIRCIGYIQHFWSGHFELYIRSRSWADFDVSQTDYTLLSRIQQKIWKLANGNIYDLLYDRSAERLVLEPQYLLYGVGEGFFERFIPYDGFEALLSPGVFDVFHVNEIHSSFFWCLVFVWIDSDYFFGVLDLEEMWFGVTGHSGRQCWHCWRKLLRWWTADSHFSGLLLWWQGSPGRRKIRNMSKNGSGVLFERGVLLNC